MKRNKLTKDEFLSDDLEITGSTMYSVEVASSFTGNRSEIRIENIRRLITKMYTKYEDEEAREFLENL